ncbi:hypothetical protein STEG23_016116, partial [Scotinomys teguina]
GLYHLLKIMFKVEFFCSFCIGTCRSCKNQTQSKCPSTDECEMKGYSSTESSCNGGPQQFLKYQCQVMITRSISQNKMEQQCICCQRIKYKLNMAGKWMELDNMILSKVTQTHNDKH